jgi:hypothetical protein
MQEFIRTPAGRNSISKRKIVCGVGINDAYYNVTSYSNGREYMCPIYSKWKSMLQRCYNKTCQDRHPTYKGCSVCSEWFTFSSFSDWYEVNYVKGYDIDKDIKIKGNRVYSPNTCLLVPRSINGLILDCKRSRGDYPVGVSFHKLHNKFIAKISIDHKRKHIGYFSSHTEAGNAYIKAKNAEIMRKCEQYPKFAKYLINHVVC